MSESAMMTWQESYRMLSDSWFPAHGDPMSWFGLYGGLICGCIAFFAVTCGMCCFHAIQDATQSPAAKKEA